MISDCKRLSFPFLFGLLLWPHFAFSAGETVTIPAAPFTLPSGKTVKIIFDVTIDLGLPHGLTTLSNQGTLSGSNFLTLTTGDPDETGTGDPFDATTTLAINNTPPVLDDTESPALDPINEDIPNGSNTGITVATLLSRTGAFTGDADGDTLGIAVTAADNTNGDWQYDENGGDELAEFRNSFRNRCPAPCGNCDDTV